MEMGAFAAMVEGERQCYAARSEAVSEANERERGGEEEGECCGMSRERRWWWE